MTVCPTATQVSSARHSVKLSWSDGTSAEFASEWLRDNILEDRDAHSGQRLIDIADVPPDPQIDAAVVIDDALRIDWLNERRTSMYPLRWLYRRSRHIPRPEFEVHHWLEGATLDAQRDFAWLSLPVLATDSKARLSWMTRLAQDGIAFLREVPADDAGILTAMKPVGRVAETNYGWVFDVRAVPKPENLAYSDRGLGLHTDNPYREPVPGFQALHTLIAAPDGGDNLLADGWAIAEHLRATEPAVFATLTRIAAPFHYRSQDADLYAERPLIQLNSRGSVVAVHYNSRSIAPLELPLEQCREFYSAYRRFGALLRESRFQARLRLNNGELMLFDNQRILHGRTGFASAAHPRHLRGCYLTRDSVFSEIGLLRRAGEESP
jgi:gamma-butyrobetaine dioxygenase